MKLLFYHIGKIAVLSQEGPQSWNYFLFQQCDTVENNDLFWHLREAVEIIHIAAFTAEIILP